MLLKVCLAVSGKELTVLDAEEIEGKSAKALKQLGRFQELEVKRSKIYQGPRWFERLCLIWRHHGTWVNDSIQNVEIWSWA